MLLWKRSAAVLHDGGERLTKLGTELREHRSVLPLRLAGKGGCNVYAERHCEKVNGHTYEVSIRPLLDRDAEEEGERLVVGADKVQEPEREVVAAGERLAHDVYDPEDGRHEGRLGDPLAAKVERAERAAEAADELDEQEVCGGLGGASGEPQEAHLRKVRLLERPGVVPGKQRDQRAAALLDNAFEHGLVVDVGEPLLVFPAESKFENKLHESCGDRAPDLDFGLR